MRRPNDATIKMLLRAFRVLAPRYDRADTWTVFGKHTLINVHRLTSKEEDNFFKWMEEYWKARAYKRAYYRTDVVKHWSRIRTIQRTLKPSHFRYLLRSIDTWDKWPKEKRPLLVEWRGQLVIWNGTHRTVLSYLLNKPLQTRGVNLDQFVRERKAGVV